MSKLQLIRTKKSGIDIWLVKDCKNLKPELPWTYSEDLGGWWLEYFTDGGLMVEVLTIFAHAIEVIKK